MRNYIQLFKGYIAFYDAGGIFAFEYPFIWQSRTTLENLMNSYAQAVVDGSGGAYTSFSTRQFASPLYFKMNKLNVCKIINQVTQSGGNWVLNTTIFDEPPNPALIDVDLSPRRDPAWPSSDGPRQKPGSKTRKNISMEQFILFQINNYRAVGDTKRANQLSQVYLEYVGKILTPSEVLAEMTAIAAQELAKVKV